jgi:ATP-binding cassette subfamily B protein
VRQFDAASGSVLIDNKSIQSINTDAFREQCGVVPQDVFLFSDTIANNLKFGVKDGEVSSDDLVKVTELTHVYHNIDEFPDKFETLLGERGVNLSGGQKQRISISRALLRNPSLLLLDDCLSAVDTETEEIILSNLRHLKQNLTTIIVSHRVSTIRNANYIIVIDQGEVIEEGTHETLLKSKGYYAELYQKQLTEE